MADIARLTVALHANSAQFVSELNRSRQQMQVWRTNANKSFKIVAAAGAAAAAGLTGALTAIYSEQSSLIDQTAKFADRIGISTEALSQLRYSAELTGVGASDMDMALQRMTRRIAEAATGSGEAAPALKQMGLDAQALGRMTPDQQLSVLADSFKDVESQSERVRLAFKLFDSGGVALVNMLGSGSEGLKGMADEADSLGLTLSRVSAAKVEMANDAMTRVSATATAFKQELTTQLAPVIAGIGELFTENAKKHGGMASYISDGLESIVKGVGFVADGFQGWKVVLKGVEVIWKGFTSAFKVIAQGIVNITHEMGKAMFQAIVWPIQTALELAGKFSDEAKDLAKTVNEFSNVEPIKLFDDDGIDSLVLAKDELHKLSMEKMPSIGIDKWFNENKEKFQKLSEEYAANINQNSLALPPVINTKNEAAAASALKKIEETRIKELESSRQSILDLRQSLMTKSQIENEAWSVQQSKLSAWREAELQAIKNDEQAKLAIDEEYKLLKSEAHRQHLVALNQAEIENHQKSLNLMDATQAYFLASQEGQKSRTEQMAQFNVDSINSATDGIAGAVSQTLFYGESLKDGLGQIAQNIASEFVKMLIKIQIQEAVTRMLGKTSFLSQTTASASAQVAMAGLNAFTSTAAIPIVGPLLAPAAATAATAVAAPMAASAIAAASSGFSYHTGGIAGQQADSPLKSNEIYAKLLKKEEVLTEDDPRHRNNIASSNSTASSKRPLNIIIHNNVAAATATTQEDGEGNYQVYLEKADEHIANGIASGFSKTGMAIENFLSGSRVGYR